MLFRLIPCALALIIVSGCVSVQPALTATAAVDPNSGYVSGQFSANRSANFAFSIRSLEGDKHYTMSLGKDNFVPTAFQNETVAIKLPPGRYMVHRWYTYATMTKAVITSKDLDNSMLATPFAVRAGSVTHLGAYDLTQDTAIPMVFNYMIQPLPLRGKSVEDSFDLAYPHLAELPFQCVFCYDTPVGVRPAL